MKSNKEIETKVKELWNVVKKQTGRAKENTLARIWALQWVLGKETTGAPLWKD